MMGFKIHPIQKVGMCRFGVEFLQMTHCRRLLTFLRPALRGAFLAGGRPVHPRPIRSRLKSLPHIFSPYR